MLALITDPPQSEEQIMAQEPISWKCHEIDLNFPRFSYRDYKLFDKAIKLLGLKALAVDGMIIPTELMPALTMIGDELAATWWDEMGLCYILARFSTALNRESAVFLLKKWQTENPTHSLTMGMDIELPIGFRLALTSYIASNSFPDELVEVSNKLLQSQYLIKKKLAILLAKREVVIQNMDSRRSQDMLRRQELIRQRRSKLILIHSS